MVQNFRVFDTGIPGAALLLLRLSIAFFLGDALFYAKGPALLIKVGVAVLAGALILGACTRLAAAVSAASIFAVCARSGDQLGLLGLVQSVEASSLCMLGGGAYSIDAQLFGRRVIRVGK